MADPQQAATEYASRGWQVFPCKPARKIPLTTHGCKDATSDVAQIQEWWKQWPKANVALATGTTSGLIVIDIDGEDGEDSLRRLESEHCPLPATLEARTGGGGRHLFFLHPGRKVRNQARKLGAGLDVRGDGGYVVLPPSGHPSGEHYRWLTDTDPAPIPGWLSALVEERKRAPVPPPSPPQGASAYGKKALQEEVRKIAQTPEGARNHALNEAAFALGQLVAGGELERAEVEAHLFAAGTNAGLAAREVKATIGSGLGAGQEIPRKAPEKPMPPEPAKTISKPVLEVMPGGKVDLAELVSMARDGQAIIGEATMPGFPMLEFEATNIRRSRTGIHATVKISCNGQPLQFDTFNIERAEDRRRLAVAAASFLKDDKPTAQAIRLRLDQFCSRLWSMWIAGTVPVRRRGSDVPANRVLLRPYITDSRTIVFAPGGAGKSYLSLIWALSLQYGLAEPWSAPEPVPVLWMDFEDTPQVFENRLAQAARVLGCPDALDAFHFDEPFLSVYDAVRSYVRSHDVGLLMVDSISRLALGDLNDNEPANRTIDMLNGLGVPWLALGHTPKASDARVFGSAHYEYGARVVIKATPAVDSDDESLIGIRLEITKANHIRRGQVTTWALRFADDLLVEHRPARPGEFPDLGDARPIRQRVKDYLSSVAEASVEEIVEWTEGSDRSVRRVLLDGEGTSYERIAGGRGKGIKHVWRRLELVESPAGGAG